MNTVRACLAFAAGLSACAALAAGPEPQAGAAPQALSFVACPVYRDTDAGVKSGCWLAADPASGQRYDVGLGRTKPQIGREVLVEGVVSAAPDVCGGVVLEPVHVSVLETRCKGFIVPAEGHPGRRFVLPREVMQPTDVPRPRPPPPYDSREFVIEFDMHSDFLAYQYSEVILEHVYQYILASRPKQVRITGYSVTAPIEVSGRQLAEEPALAESRAQMVAEALRRLGVAPALLRVEWNNAPQPAAGAPAGLEEASKRRVSIFVQL